MEKDRNIIFPAGVISLHTTKEKRNNALLSNSERAKQTATMNTTEYLRDTILARSNIYRSYSSDGGVIQTMEPAYPYSYGGIMIIAAPESVANPDGKPEMEQGRVKTRNIYDCSEGMQVEYFRQTIANILTHENLYLPGEHRKGLDDVYVMAYENTNPAVSDEITRVPRSIALPHMLVIRRGPWLQEDRKQLSKYSLHIEQNLLKEQEWFEKFYSQYTKMVDESVPEVVDTTGLYFRTLPPYGYTLSTSIEADVSIGQQAQMLARLMSANNNFYRDSMEKVMDEFDNIRQQRRQIKIAAHGGNHIPPKLVKDIFVPQPSYRTYIYYRNRKLNVTICPEFISPTGALEGMGLGSEWGTDKEKLYTDEELLQFKTIYSEILRNMLQSTDS
jgi:hypothetical protein